MRIYVAFAFLVISYVYCQECDQYIVALNDDVKSQCDCARIVSEAVYKGGIPSDVIKTNAVTATWTSPNTCIGCFTDPDNNFLDTLEGNTNVSKRASGCNDDVQYMTYVTPAMATEELPFSFDDCNDEDYAQDSNETTQDEDYAQNSNETTPNPDEEGLAPNPNEDSEEGLTPNSDEDFADSLIPSPDFNPYEEGLTPYPAPAPPPNRGRKTAAMSLILFYITTFLAICALGQEPNVAIFSTTNTVCSSSNQQESASNSNTAESSTTGSSTSSYGGSNSFAINAAINNALSTSRTITSTGPAV